MRGFHQLSRHVPNHQHQYTLSWPVAEIEPAVRIGGTRADFQRIGNCPFDFFPMRCHFRVPPKNVSGPCLLMKAELAAQRILKRAVSHSFLRRRLKSVRRKCTTEPDIGKRHPRGMPAGGRGGAIGATYDSSASVSFSASGRSLASSFKLSIGRLSSTRAPGSIASSLQVRL